MSQALSVPYEYRYAGSSRLEPGDGRLRLFTCDTGDRPSTYYFTGRLQRPRRSADQLRALFKVVQSRFHVPAAMLGRILAQADPVVTCYHDSLRWEGFSACCGAYARVDWTAEAIPGESFGRGTTNVDFNAPLLAALAAVRPADRLTVSVGAGQIEVSKNDDAIVEKKVALPLRWVKGFAEVQACLSRMVPRLETTGVEAQRFFRSLPRMKTNRRETFVTPAGRGFRLSQLPQAGAVRVGGLERLRVLEELATDAESLRVYSDDLTGSSAWELDFGDSRFQLAISPEVWRGFSGEGQTLASLAGTAWRDELPLVRAQLQWQSTLPAERLAERLDLPVDSVRGALAALAALGLVGYDVRAAEYYHRELPFQLDRLETLNPRWKHARRLLAEGRVRAGDPAVQAAANREFWVRSSDVEHRVVLAGDEPKCTCPWFSRHGVSRGPCKHILAVQMILEESEHA